MPKNVSKTMSANDMLNELWLNGPLEPWDAIEVFFENACIQDWDDVVLVHDNDKNTATFVVEGAVIDDDVLEEQNFQLEFDLS